MAVLTLPVSAQGQEALKTADGIEYRKSTHTYKTAGDHDILADVYFGKSDKPRPAIIWIHGGGLIFGTRQWLPEGQLRRYLNAGYAVVAIDHRLVPETKIPAIVEDLKDAYQWVLKAGPAEYNVDPDRIAFVGASSGAYLTLMGGVVLEPRPKALVSFYGFGDVTGDWSALPNPHFNQAPAIPREEALSVVGTETVSTDSIQYQHNGRPKFFRYTKQQGSWLEEASGHDRKDTGWFAQFEPIQNVTADYPPTFLIHGEKDTDVPFQQSLMIAEQLNNKGVVQKTLIRPDWEHLFDINGAEDPAVQDVLDQVVEFLAQHL